MEEIYTPALTLESNPNSVDICYLEELIHAFNVQATGIFDGTRFGTFLRGADGVVVGGADGWTWGQFGRALRVPAALAGLPLIGRAAPHGRHCAALFLYLFSVLASK